MARVHDGTFRTDIEFPVTVNSLPEIAANISDVYPQITRVPENEITVEATTGAAIRFLTSKVFVDAEGDSLSYSVPVSENPGVVEISIDGDYLVINGKSVSTTPVAVTFEVSDGRETREFRANVKVEPLKLSGILLNTMPINYSWRR